MTATIQSYLVYPASGCKEQVETALAAMPGCEVLPAENESVLILVTETLDRPAQKELERRLESMDEITHLALVSGFTEEIDAQ